MKIKKIKGLFLPLSLGVILVGTVFFTSASFVVSKQEPNTLKEENVPEFKFENDILDKLRIDTTNNFNKNADAIFDGKYFTGLKINASPARRQKTKADEHNENLIIDAELLTLTKISTFVAVFANPNILRFNFEYQDTELKEGGWKVAAAVNDKNEKAYFINLPKPIIAKRVRINIIDWNSIINSNFEPEYVVNLLEFGAFADKIKSKAFSINPDLSKNAKIGFGKIDGGSSDLEIDSSKLDFSEGPHSIGIDNMSNTNRYFYQLTFNNPESIKIYRISFKNKNINQIRVETTYNSNTNIISTTYNKRNFPNDFIFKNNDTKNNVTKILVWINEWEGDKVDLDAFQIYAIDLDNSNSIIEGQNRENKNSLDTKLDLVVALIITTGFVSIIVGIFLLIFKNKKGKKGIETQDEEIVLNP